MDRGEEIRRAAGLEAAGLMDVLDADVADAVEALIEAVFVACRALYANGADEEQVISAMSGVAVVAALKVPH